MLEKQEIVMGARVSKRIYDRVVAEQLRIEKQTGIRPSINEVVRMLLERGLDSNGKKGRR